MINSKLPHRRVPSPLTLACVSLCGDSETRGTGTREASHDVVAGMRAGGLEGTLVFI